MPRSDGRSPRRLLAAALVFLVVSHASPLPEPVEAAEPAPYAALFSHAGLIRKGDRGELVRGLQQVLDALGYKTSADGQFGDGTRSLVVKFQKDHGLRADGVAGAATLGALSLEYYRRNLPERHTVKAGETLSSIAARYALSVEFLARTNRLVDPDAIYAGQSLLLKEDPSMAEPESDPEEGLAPAVDLLPAPALPAPAKRVCLSFDDGPDVYTTRQILSILSTYGVKATFFLVGDRAVRDPDLVQEIAVAGHVIGVHGYDHKTLAGLSASEVRKDLKKAHDALLSISGVKPHLYRPPGGSLDRTQIEEAGRLGLTTLMWTNVGGADLGAGSAQEVTSRVTGSAKDGGVILLHEGLQLTVEALPSIIEALARLGFGFQNVSPASTQR